MALSDSPCCGNRSNPALRSLAGSLLFRQVPFKALRTQRFCCSFLLSALSRISHLSVPPSSVTCRVNFECFEIHNISCCVNYLLRTDCNIYFGTCASWLAAQQAINAKVHVRPLFDLYVTVTAHSVVGRHPGRACGVGNVRIRRSCWQSANAANRSEVCLAYSSQADADVLF